MKHKIMGFLALIFFILFPYYIESMGGSFLALLQPTGFLMVFGGSAGLTIASYRPGMKKQSILKRLKRYFIACGIIAPIIGLIIILGKLGTPQELFQSLSVDLIPLFYGVTAAYITDVFIEDN